MWITYGVIAFLLLMVELIYFKVADKFNIIDKPNERSSHKTIVLRGGGIIFTIGLWIWSIVFGFQYPWLLAGPRDRPTALGYVVDNSDCINCSSRWNEHI